MAEEWIPLYVKPKGLKVAVFGGGSVAARRAELLAGAGAEVTVYALDFAPRLVELSTKGVLRLVKVELREADVSRLLEGVSLVIVALSDMELSEKIAEMALERGLLVNNSVKASKGNVIVPYRGKTSYGLRVATTSLGETGVGARRALERLLGVLESDPYYRTLFKVMARVKAYLKENIGNPAVRFKANLAADADESVHRLAAEGLEEEAYRRALAAALKAIHDAGDP